MIYDLTKRDGLGNMGEVRGGVRICVCLCVCLCCSLRVCGKWEALRITRSGRGPPSLVVLRTIAVAVAWWHKVDRAGRSERTRTSINTTLVS